MTRWQLLPLLALSVSALAGAALPAMAATARASDPISIFDSPHSMGRVIGKLLAGEEVHIDTCTPSGAWCRVIHDGPTGWVPGSYLVGATAKMEADPPRDLTAPPLDQQRDLQFRAGS